MPPEPERSLRPTRDVCVGVEGRPRSGGRVAPALAGPEIPQHASLIEHASDLPSGQEACRRCHQRSPSAPQRLEDRDPLAPILLHFTARQLWGGLKTACKLAGVVHRSPHELRRRYISRLVLAGIDPVRIARVAGHAKASMSLDEYSGVLLDEPLAELRALRRAVDRLFVDAVDAADALPVLFRCNSKRGPKPPPRMNSLQMKGIRGEWRIPDSRRRGGPGCRSKSPIPLHERYLARARRATGAPRADAVVSGWCHAFPAAVVAAAAVTHSSLAETVEECSGCEARLSSAAGRRRSERRETWSPRSRAWEAGQSRYPLL